jgi:pimeloyl-ACP methyl ester carboxylesterase
MPYLDLQDYRIFYNDTGDGPPLVLLHNGFYSTATWDPIRNRLAEHFRVIDYDRFGYGKSTKRETMTDDEDVIDEGVQELEAVIETLGLEEVNLIGHCLGGAIALVYTARRPERVAKIVAAAVGYHGGLKMLVSTDMTFVPFEQIDAILKNRLITMHGEAYARKLWALLRSHKNSYIMNEHYDIRKEVFRIRKPLLIANGDRDFYFDVAHALSIYDKMRKRADLWIVPSAGHDLHMDHPDLFIDEVLRFLK